MVLEWCVLFRGILVTKATMRVKIITGIHECFYCDSSYEEIM